LGGFWQSPEIQGGAIPFIATFLATLAIRLGGGPVHGARLAIVAPGLGFLLAYYLIEGAAWPAVASKQKVLWIAVTAVALGLLVHLASRRRALALAVAYLAPLAALAWLDWRRLTGDPDLGRILTWVVLYLAALLALWSLHAAAGERRPTGPDDPRDGAGRGGVFAPLLVMVAAFAAGVISLFSAFIGMAQASIAVGAVLGGYLLAAYPFHIASGRSFAFGAGGLVGVAGIWIACLFVMALFGFSMNRVALAILLLAFPAGWLARRVRVGTGRTARILEPVVFGVLVAIPAAAGAAYAILTAEPGVVQ